MISHFSQSKGTLGHSMDCESKDFLSVVLHYPNHMVTLKYQNQKNLRVIHVHYMGD